MLPLRFQFVRSGFLLSLLISGCGQVELSPQAMALARERCPNDAYTDASGQPTHELSDSALVPLAGKIAGIPEYHDCQRLLLRTDRRDVSPLTYGPLVGIWARDEIRSVPASFFDRPGGVAVAVLLNFSQIAYPDLRIGPGYSCLYLQRTAGRWRAVLENLGGTRNCPDTLSARSYDASVLEVQVQRRTQGAAPPAARWDMDPKSNIQYMGVWCPDGWCEIGLRGFTPSVEHTGAPEWRVKGWYDEQYLSVFDGNTQMLRLTSIRGRTVPAARLDTLQLSQFECRNCNGMRYGGWIHVATVLIEKDSADYFRRKLNLIPNDSNRVYIRHNVDAGRWEARVVNKTATRFAQMIRVDHRNISVPGTSRWHFVPRDETVWVRCSDGCCDVSHTL